MATVLDDRPGVLEIRTLASSSEPGKTYDMYRTRHGWEHADPLACRGALERGVCSHMNELTAETPDPLVPEVINSALEIVEELESSAIIEGLAGRVSPTWIYDIPNVGTDLSVIGVENAAREMAVRGEPIREVDVGLVEQTDEEAFFMARCVRYAVNGSGQEVALDSAVRGKRVSKFTELRPETARKKGHTGQPCTICGVEGAKRHREPNPNWYEVGIAKAARNAKKALISQEVREHIIDEAKKGGATRTRTAAPRTAQAPPTEGVTPAEPPPAAAAPAADDIGKLRNHAGKAFEDYAALHGMVSAIELVAVSINKDAIVDGNLKLGELSIEDCKAVIDAAYAEPVPDAVAPTPADAGQRGLPTN